MNVADVARDALRYIAEEGRPLSQVPEADLSHVAVAMSGVWGELWAFAPGPLKASNLAAALLTPYDLPGINLTQGQATITGTVPASAIGNSVRVPGESGWNEIASATRLLNPVLGASRTAQLSVYCDTVLCPADTHSVVGKVSMDGGKSFLGKLDSEEEFRAFQFKLAPAVPMYWWLQPAAGNSSTQFQARLRVVPAPVSPHMVSFVVERGAPVYEASDLTAATPREIGLPPSLVHTAFLPLVRAAMMTHPHFDGDKQAIESAATRGRAAFRAWHPSVLSDGSMLTATTGNVPSRRGYRSG